MLELHQAELDIAYTEARNRLTVLFRIILAIPHLVVSYVWGYVVQLAAIAQWFICVITGKRNHGIWEFTNNYLGYTARVGTYAGLLHDVFPPFGTTAGAVPVRYNLEFDEPANRLTVLLRLIWAIPAMIVAWLYGLATFVLTIISWFVIVITGKHPRGLFDFMAKAHRVFTQFNAYVYLATDKYPALSM